MQCALLLDSDKNRHSFRYFFFIFSASGIPARLKSVEPSEQECIKIIHFLPYLTGVFRFTFYLQQKLRRKSRFS